MKAEEALDYVSLRLKAAGVEAFDAIAGESESAGLEVYEGKVKTTELNVSRGIGIRLFRDNHPGYAYCEKYSIEALDLTIAAALENSYLTGELHLRLPEPAALAGMEIHSYDPAIEEVTFEQMKKFCLELEQKAKTLDPRIKNIPYLGASRSTSRFIIRNSQGVHLEKKSASVSAGLGVVAHSGNNRKMGVYSNGARSFNFDSDYMAQTAAERAISLLDARPIPSGDYPVLLTNRVASQLFGMFSSIFFADLAQKGQSRLKDRLGDEIAVKDLNLVSDPFIPEAPGSMLFDGEGVPARKIQVIEDGRFVSFLHNLESAYRAEVEPTGNASRGYSGRVGTAFANLVVPVGQAKISDLQQMEKQVLQIEKLEGASGCSAVSGEISIGAQGFLWEHGRMVQPVDRITINGNFFDLLTSIHHYSDSYSDSFSSVKVPDLLVSGLKVAG